MASNKVITLLRGLERVDAFTISRICSEARLLEGDFKDAVREAQDLTDDDSLLDRITEYCREYWLATKVIDLLDNQERVNLCGEIIRLFKDEKVDINAAVRDATDSLMVIDASDVEVFETNEHLAMFRKSPVRLIAVDMVERLLKEGLTDDMREYLEGEVLR